MFSKFYNCFCFWSIAIVFEHEVEMAKNCFFFFLRRDKSRLYRWIYEDPRIADGCLSYHDAIQISKFCFGFFVWSDSSIADDFAIFICFFFDIVDEFSIRFSWLNFIGCSSVYRNHTTIFWCFENEIKLCFFVCFVKSCSGFDRKGEFWCLA